MIVDPEQQYAGVELAWKSTLTRALSWKSPAGGVPSRVAALSNDSASVESGPAGLT